MPTASPIRPMDTVKMEEPLNSMAKVFAERTRITEDILDAEVCFA